MTRRAPSLSRRALVGGALGTGALTALPRLPAWAAGSIAPGANTVLLVIDVQNCFLPGGTLPVPAGDEVVPIINALSKKFENVVLTQDWHTEGHASFASSHPGKAPFETIELAYGTQVLWPDHCVQGSADAMLAPGLDIPHAQLVIRKGYHDAVDSYSAFLEADKATRTGLTGYLQERGLDEVYVCGLATDFCVGWTAIDARKAGLKVAVVEDACRAIDLNGSLELAWDAMNEVDVDRVKTTDFA